MSRSGSSAIVAEFDEVSDIEARMRILQGLHKEANVVELIAWRGEVI